MADSDEISVAEAVDELTKAAWPTEGKTSYETTLELFIKHRRLLLTDEAERLLAQHFESNSKQLDELPECSDRLLWMVLHSITERLELVTACRTVGIKSAFAAMDGMLTMDFALTIGNFLSMNSRATGSWRHARKFLTPEMLSPRFFELVSEAEWVRRLDLDGQLTLGKLYERIEAAGLDAALADIEEFGTDIPESLRPLLRAAMDAHVEYTRSGDRISLSSALRNWEKILGSEELTSASRRTQQQVLLDAAHSFDQSFKERGEPAHLSRAIEIWRKVDRRSTPNHDRYHYLAYSYERLASNALNSAAEHPDRAAEHGTEVCASAAAAIEMYGRALELAKSHTSNVPPAPTSEGGGGFEEWQRMRRQIAHHENSIGRLWLTRHKITGDHTELDTAIVHLDNARELLEEGDKSPNIPRDWSGRVVGLIVRVG